MLDRHHCPVRTTRSLPFGRVLVFEVWLVLSPWESQDTALRPAKRNCHAQHVFANFTDFLAGEGHCEVHHEVCNCDVVEAEIISVSTFVAIPFTIRDAGQKLSCFIDPNACFFAGLRGFVEACTSHSVGSPRPQRRASGVTWCDKLRAQRR